MKQEKKKEASGVAYHRAIISATMDRDATLSKEELFKKLKVDDLDADELKVLLGICFNAIVELSRININIRARLTDLIKFIQIPLTDEQRAEIEANTEEALKSRHLKKQTERKMEEAKNEN